MGRNVSGVYTLPAGSTIANGDTSDASDLNTPLADLESDANEARPIVAGGTGATTAANARTNLGLAIGINVQAYDAALTSIAGLSWVADRYPYTTGADTFAMGTITTAGRAILDDADAAAQRTTLGLVIGTNVQAYDAALGSLAGLSLSNGDILYATGADTLARLAAGTNGHYLTLSSGVPAWAAVGLPAPDATTTHSSLATSTTYNHAHGFGAVPRLIRASIVCTSASNGFAVGDEVETFNYQDSTNGLGVWKNATNSSVRIGAALSVIGPSGLVTLTLANFNIRVDSWR